MNLSEAIIKEIKQRIPHYINILNRQENVLKKEPVIPRETLTKKQKKNKD